MHAKVPEEDEKTRQDEKPGRMTLTGAKDHASPYFSEIFFRNADVMWHKAHKSIKHPVIYASMEPNPENRVRQPNF